MEEAILHVIAEHLDLFPLRSLARLSITCRQMHDAISVYLGRISRKLPRLYVNTIRQIMGNGARYHKKTIVIVDPNRHENWIEESAKISTGTLSRYLRDYDYLAVAGVTFWLSAPMNTYAVVYCGEHMVSYARVRKSDFTRVADNCFSVTPRLTLEWNPLPVSNMGIKVNIAKSASTDERGVISMTTSQTFSQRVIKKIIITLYHFSTVGDVYISAPYSWLTERKYRSHVLSLPRFRHIDRIARVVTSFPIGSL